MRTQLCVWVWTVVSLHLRVLTDGSMHAKTSLHAFRDDLKLVFMHVRTWNTHKLAIQLSPLSGLFVGAGQNAQYSNPWCTTRWQLHCLSDRQKLFAGMLDQQIKPLLGDKIRWQAAVWKVPPLPAQTMPLIHSLLIIRLADITFQYPTHLFFSLFFPLTHSPFHQEEGLKQKRLHHAN